MKKREISIIGFVFFFTLFLYTVFYRFFETLNFETLPNEIESILSFACFFILALPAGASVLCCIIPAQSMPEKKKLSLSQFTVSFFVIWGIFNSGLLLTAWMPAEMKILLENRHTFANSTKTVALQVALSVFAGPIAEEFVFRKILLCRLTRYSERDALIYSSAVFALIHCSFVQLPSTFFLGFALGYLYLKSGQLSACIAIHSGINLLNGFLLPLVGDYLRFSVLSIVLIVSLPCTVILFIILRRKVTFRKGTDFTRNELLNTGNILFLCLSISTMVYIYL